MAQEIAGRRRLVRKSREVTREADRGSGLVKSATGRSTKALAGKQSQDEPFPIVGIGASAGGLEAFTQLLRALPSDINMALVLVQHLDPTYKSLLTELLSKTTKLSVTEVTDGTRVKPKHVYIIPPNTTMTISKGTLHLTPRVEADRKHSPIDHFLQSLAQDQKGRAIGIILSGTSTDGVQGLRAIKDEGGITIAQDEKSAKYYDLPRSAVAAGCVDLVLDPRDMARELAKLSQHPYVTDLETERVEELLPQSDLDKIFILLKKATGVDFTGYKHATIKRRILRRMLLLKISKMENYVDHLQKNPGELNSLFQDVLINVTGFFREPATFEALQSEIFPSILKNRSAEDPIRIWIPGCSTGEEAYSVAICILEQLDHSAIKSQINVFATDVNEAVLEKARQGIYQASSSISPERLKRFFVKTNGAYQINKNIRRTVLFAKQNVTADPPFSKLDLIICRNLLIYLGQTLQRRLLPIFHYALKPTGFLVLGDFETIGEFDNIFKIVNKRYRIYSKKPVVSRAPLDFSMKYLGEQGPLDSAAGNRPVENPVPEPTIFKEADRIMLARYTPASVIVNNELEIIQFRGRTGPFLEPAPGKASLNVLKMAREGMMTDLRNALDRARKSGEPVSRKGIAIKSDGKYLDLNLEVVPLKAQPGSPCFIVTFEETLPKPVATVLSGRSLSATREKEQRVEDLRFVRLKQELAANKDYLQSIIEDKEAANEELRAANEEIQSSNEELQSTNEELETAKEELQSTNEELTTVNEELQNRNLELTQVNNDMMNINTIFAVPLLMLGTDLRLRRWGPFSESLFNLKASDVGRSISDLDLGMQIPNLRAAVSDVVDNVTYKEIEARGPQGRWYLVRIRPYRTMDNKIEGAVLAFVDIDQLKQVEEKLRARSEHLEDLVEDRTRMLSNATRLAAIGETAGMVGHDLRNPLQTIINTLHLAKEAMKMDEKLGPGTSLKVENALETVGEQVGFMNKIVSDLQDYAREPKPTLVEYDVKRLIDETLSSVPIPQSVEVSSAVEKNFPKVNVDPSLLRRAFTNIITNALQAMPDGGKLRIRAWMSSDKASVSFQDTGKGISDDAKAKIFSPLFTTREKGVGLGLAVTKRLIESHKGDVGVESKLGEGTTLTVEIPVNLKR